MTDIKIEKHKWQPNFKDETWITTTDGFSEFQITIKQDDDIEITFDGKNDSGRMTIPVDVLKKLITELGM